jgi:hypothetical protein
MSNLAGTKARQMFRGVGNDEQLDMKEARQRFREEGNDEQLGGSGSKAEV